MARPVKTDNEKRSEQVKIRLTLAEIEYLRSQANAADITLADFVRQSALACNPADHVLRVALNPVQAATLSEHAQALELTEADYARRRILQHRIPAGQKTAVKLLAEVNRVGVNVNQLARNLHSGRQFRIDWREVRQQVMDVMQKVSGLYDH